MVSLHPLPPHHTHLWGQGPWRSRVISGFLQAGRCQEEEKRGWVSKPSFFLKFARSKWVKEDRKPKMCLGKIPPHKTRSRRDASLWKLVCLKESKINPNPKWKNVKIVWRDQNQREQSSGGRWGCKWRLSPECGSLVCRVKEFALLSTSSGNPLKTKDCYREDSLQVITSRYAVIAVEAGKSRSHFSSSQENQRTEKLSIWHNS